MRVERGVGGRLSFQGGSGSPFEGVILWEVGLMRVDRSALERCRFRLALLREVIFKLGVHGEGVRQGVGGSTLPS